jgi:hypothetical protein
VYDDDRLAFVPAQRAGRLRPDVLQLLDILGVDVAEI